VRAALDLADEDHVVAFVVAAAVEALEAGRRADQHRRAAGPSGEGHVGPAVDVLGGEALGQRLLVRRQDVDRVVRAGAERGHRAGRARQAPQHQRRRERHRVERVGREADQRAVGRARGDDGHAGGEHAERFPEFVGRKGGRLGPSGSGH
jgi:hypothetical protein